MGKKVLFIDRDGTLIEEPEDFQVDSLEKVRLVRDVIPALLELSQHGYRFVRTLQLFTSQGVTFDEIFVCPHLPDDNCECRKPRTGLLTRYLAATDINLSQSAVIGDRATDMELASRIGVRGLLFKADDGDDPTAMSWEQIVELLCHAERVARVERATNETTIAVAVNLDSARTIEINTGIGFYDHMLEQIAKHGGFGLIMNCNGDLNVDEHHTVEDTAIVRHRTLRFPAAHGRERSASRTRLVGPGRFSVRRRLSTRQRR